MLFNLSIPAATIVLRDDNKLVTLREAVEIPGAMRTECGGFIWRIGVRRFFASAGTVTFRPMSDEWDAL